MRDICLALEASNINFKKRLPLKEYSGFHIGGYAELGIFPKTEKELTDSIALLKNSGKKYYIVGNGSNLLFGDGIIEAPLIFTSKVRGLRADGEKIYASAGDSLASLASLAAENGLTGLEFAKGIPGTVGGALFMNAGAYGGEMSDVTELSVAYDSASGVTVEITEHKFGYRTSIYMNNTELVCLGAVFSLKIGDKTEINEKMKVFAESRREKQPLNLPSAGSYFKRPEGHFAGKLIEDAGLKGYRVGDACVSEKHAGFIVNLGNATAEDVLRLEEYVRATVLGRFGIELEREVRIIN